MSRALNTADKLDIRLGRESWVWADYLAEGRRLAAAMGVPSYAGVWASMNCPISKRPNEHAARCKVLNAVFGPSPERDAVIAAATPSELNTRKAA